MRSLRNDRVGPSTTKTAARGRTRAMNASAARIGSSSIEVTDVVVLFTLLAAAMVDPQSAAVTRPTDTTARTASTTLTPVMREASAMSAVNAAAPRSGSARAVPKKRIKGIGRPCW